VKTPLIDLGIDSLVAVEVRSWFVKELNVDMPVLKVLGGASISNLVAIALEKLQLEFVPNMGTLKGVSNVVSHVRNISNIESVQSDGSRSGESSSSDISSAATEVSTPSFLGK
jgi:hybrid polyketide synthase/nonribosomal peptide synthetase ACE1